MELWGDSLFKSMAQCKTTVIARLGGKTVVAKTGRQPFNTKTWYWKKPCDLFYEVNLNSQRAILLVEFTSWFISFSFRSISALLLTYSNTLALEALPEYFSADNFERSLRYLPEYWIRLSGNNRGRNKNRLNEKKMGWSALTGLCFWF